ncbi:uncharacterized protein LOC128518483 isoform X1 [Clarias gariepinus]|uniref:uncharacterized protein LOC128518483 isoform X1 n=1 Tax=Clarias gariepinus TaxID=13013 RepID=UPI00234D1F97|nr:uncharacterized protein LOC128518483 isoform X1 [Clarias gariepinus]
MKLICQNCNVQYEKIKDLKSHVRSYKHKQEVAKLFQTAVHKGPVYFPMFIFLDYLRNPNQTDPIIGFDMVTMFITPEKIGALYLCHVCEKALSTADVVEHLCSGQHYFNYFASTNPEFLRFAWLSDAFSYLQSHATKEYNNKGPGSLRVYDLAKMVMRKCKKLHYHQVMAVLSKTDKLMEHIQAGIPRRKSIQEYITDPARANPLLGLNLFIEYSCPNNKGYCGYLCIVCKKNISANQSISHCISFDHIYWYLKAAHPTTLVSPKSSYSNYSTKFQKEILNLAKQAQTVCPSTEVQTVHVDLECFKVVKTSSFANALEKLKGIVKEKNLSELNVSVTPGKRIMFAPEDHESPASTATTETLAKQPEEKVQKGPATQTKDDPPCKVMCVECDKTLDFIINYKGHIKGKQHKQKLTELFGPGQYSGAIPQIKLYQYMWNRHGKQSSRPVIGLSLITVFIHRQSVDINVPFYICHACELNIPVSSASIHLTSTQHYFNVFSYSKPDFVFLGSWNLDHFAQEEERRQGKRNMVLHVCELPRQLFTDLRILAYDKIMEKIGIHFAKLKKSIQVEKRVTVQTYSKSCERKSPLLGLQFVVKCTTSNNHYSRCIYMCLLCEKMLPERHAIAHLLSFPHIFAYLDVAHHGSLSKEDSEQKALVMDLAQQAEKINPNTSLREVDLSFGTFNEIEKNSFKAAVNVLQVAFRNKGLGELKPPAVPGAKLISSFEKNKESNSSECKKQGQTSLDMEKLNTDEANTNATMPKTEEKGSSECPDLLHTKHEELQKTTCVPSTHIQPAEPSLAPAQSDWPPSESSIPSLDTLKSEPLNLDQKSLSQQELPDRISTQDPPTVQQPQPQDSDVPEQQNAKLVQKPVELVEALQKAAETETPVVPQTQSSTCTELRSYLKMPNRPPVIGSLICLKPSTVAGQAWTLFYTQGQAWTPLSSLETPLLNLTELERICCEE